MAENNAEDLEFDKLFEDILNESPKSVDEKIDNGDFKKVKEPKKKNQAKKQNKNLPQKQVKTKEEKSKDEKKKNSSFGKIIFKTIFYTLFCLATTLSFLAVSLSSVAPDLMVKAFEYVGAEDVVYTIYKRKYNRNNSNENLYNVIQMAIDRKDYQDMSEYIEIMMNGDTFAKFAKKIDEETKKALGEVYSIYANSYEAYLKSNWVLALYKSDNTLSAKALALDSIDGSVRELKVYVDCIQEDENLSDNQKKTELLTLQSRFKLVDRLKDRLAGLDDEYSMETTDGGKLVAINQKILILDVIMAIGEFSLNEEELASFESSRSDLTAEASEILTKLKAKA